MGMGDEEEIGKGDKQTDRQRAGDGEMVTKRNGRERDRDRELGMAR